MTAADRPSVTDDARADLHPVVTEHQIIGTQTGKQGAGQVVPEDSVLCIKCGWMRCSDYTWHLSDALAAGRAETTTEQPFSDNPAPGIAHNGPNTNIPPVTDNARADEVPRLSIEDGYLVARVDRCTCEPYYGAHEIHCGTVDHYRLDNLPGWPGRAETTTATVEEHLACTPEDACLECDWTGGPR